MKGKVVLPICLRGLYYVYCNCYYYNNNTIYLRMYGAISIIVNYTQSYGEEGR